MCHWDLLLQQAGCYQGMADVRSDRLITEMDYGLHSFFKDGFLRVQASLASLFFPSLCGLCSDERPAADSNLCVTCSDSINRVSAPFCTCCGLPTPGLELWRDGVCGRCLSKRPQADRVRYGARYEGALRHGLIRLKYYGALHTVPALGEIASETFQTHFRAEDLDLIIPIPIHTSRLVKRGFNQSIVLGQHLSAATGLPMARTTLLKIKDTPPQVGLPRAERLRNVRGSFGVARNSEVAGRRILLVDDVATTGSTIQEAARTLKRAGTKTVDALVVALRLDSALPLDHKEIAIHPPDR
jgi:ComF family protein